MNKGLRMAPLNEKGQYENPNQSDGYGSTAGSFQPLRCHALRISGEREPDAALHRFHYVVQNKNQIQVSFT